MSSSNNRWETTTLPCSSPSTSPSTRVNENGSNQHQEERQQHHDEGDASLRSPHQHQASAAVLRQAEEQATHSLPQEFLLLEQQGIKALAASSSPPSSPPTSSIFASSSSASSAPSKASIVSSRRRRKAAATEEFGDYSRIVGRPAKDDDDDNDRSTPPREPQQQTERRVEAAEDENKVSDSATFRGSGGGGGGGTSAFFQAFLRLPEEFSSLSSNGSDRGKPAQQLGGGEQQQQQQDESMKIQHSPSSSPTTPLPASHFIPTSSSPFSFSSSSSQDADDHQHTRSLLNESSTYCNGTVLVDRHDPRSSSTTGVNNKHEEEDHDGRKTTVLSTSNFIVSRPAAAAPDGYLFESVVLHQQGQQQSAPHRQPHQDETTRRSTPGVLVGERGEERDHEELDRRNLPGTLLKSPPTTTTAAAAAAAHDVASSVAMRSSGAAGEGEQGDQAHVAIADCQRRASSSFASKRGASSSSILPAGAAATRSNVAVGRKNPFDIQQEKESGGRDQEKGDGCSWSEVAYKTTAGDGEEEDHRTPAGNDEAHCAPAPALISTRASARTDGSTESRKRRKPGGTPKSRNHSQWYTCYEELLKYKREHGNCNVPFAYSKQPELAQWVKRQRYQYKCKVNEKHSHLTDERQQLLEDAGFVWDTHVAAWEENFAKMVEFWEANGNCCVPMKQKELSAWAKRQRRHHKHYHDVEKKHLSTMTEDRLRRLDEIGFEWQPTTTTTTTTTTSSPSTQSTSRVTR